MSLGKDYIRRQQLRESGFTDVEIARMEGVSRQAIHAQFKYYTDADYRQRMLEKYVPKYGRCGRHKDKFWAKCYKAYETGFSCSEIGEFIGLSNDAVRQNFIRRGYKLRTLKEVGQMHRERAKQEAWLMAFLYEGNIASRQIARFFGYKHQESVYRRFREIGYKPTRQKNGLRFSVKKGTED